MHRSTSALDEGGGIESAPRAVRVENDTWNRSSGLFSFSLGAAAGAWALDLPAGFFFLATK